MIYDIATVVTAGRVRVRIELQQQQQQQQTRRCNLTRLYIYNEPNFTANGYLYVLYDYIICTQSSSILRTQTSHFIQCTI